MSFNGKGILEECEKWLILWTGRIEEQDRACDYSLRVKEEWWLFSGDWSKTAGPPLLRATSRA
jgi:hypothetical protein